MNGASDFLPSSNTQVAFPLSAIVGQRAATTALLLVAVDPALKGLFIRAPAGSGKSAIVNSLRSITGIGPFVHVPLNVTEDRLLGGIDLDRTLARGNRQSATGLLADANGGFVLADDINLLDDRIASRLAAALESGILRVEREGISEEREARFSLVGTYDPQEGEVSRLLQDRVGIIVDCTPIGDVEQRAEVTSNAFRFHKSAIEFAREYGDEMEQVAAVIERARPKLVQVRISSEYIQRLCAVGVALGVEGNRADIFAVRVARANAALAGREYVIEEDLRAAIELVLIPRATTIPIDKAEGAEPEQRRDRADDQMPESREARGTTIEDLIIAAAEARPPEELLRRSSQFRIRGLQGKRSKARSQTHGRYTGSTLRRRDGARIAVDATLRAAAPFQKRREGGATTRVKVKPDDLRFKKLRGRSGVLFIFVVDASGSMALNRMAQAKGALIRLLHDAYLHRDTVGLIALRGQSAEVLLPPTRSIDLARRVVDSLPAGGATPLAAGLMKAVEMAGSARLRRQCEVVALVFTDGRANVGLMRDESAVLGTDESIEQELRQIGALLHCKEINAAVIDTKSRFVSAGEGRKLADLLGARYLYLPRANGDELYKAVTAVAERSDSRQ